MTVSEDDRLYIGEPSADRGKRRRELIPILRQPGIHNRETVTVLDQVPVHPSRSQPMYPVRHHRVYAIRLPDSLRATDPAGAKREAVVDRHHRVVHRVGQERRGSGTLSLGVLARAWIPYRIVRRAATGPSLVSARTFLGDARASRSP